MNLPRRVLTTAALALLGACGSGGGHSTLVSVWQYVSGPAFSGTVFTDDDVTAAPRYLVLDSGGGATLVRQEATSQILFCDHGIFTTTSA